METMRKSLKIILTVFLVSILLAGCAAKASIDRGTVHVVKMPAGAPYTPTIEGWFLSDEAVTEALMAIEYYRYKWMECEGSK
jgi:hypothetical protein